MNETETTANTETNTLPPKFYNTPTVERTGMNKQKYRPVLTAGQIEHILYLAKSESPMTQAAMTIIATLSPFQAKIENAGIAAAYTMQDPKPKVNSLESLGGLASSKVLTTEPDACETKEEFWELCYEKYMANPAICSLDVIKGAQEHKYLNDLMTAEELSDFEAAMNIGAQS